MGTGPRTPVSSPGASLSDILTTAQNLVQAVNGLASTYRSVQGAQNQVGITATTLVKSTNGRLCRVSVTTAGSAVGAIYDANQTASLPTTFYVIPMTVGVVEVNMPVSLGIVVVPGTSQVVSVSYS